MSTKSIFNLKNIYELLDKEKELIANYEMHSFAQKHLYLQSCFSILSKELISYFKSDYLFHHAIYLNENNVYTPIDLIENIIKKPNQTIREFVEVIEGYLREGKRRSFTHLLQYCELKKHGFCLYKGAKDGGMINTKYFHYVDLSNSKSDVLAKFLGVNKAEVKFLFGHYQRLSKDAEFKDGLFIYFLRPFTNYTNYNGTLLIWLNRPLADNELIEIGLIWTKILSDTVVMETELNTISREHNFLFEEHTHAWNREIVALSQHLNVVNVAYDQHHQKNPNHAIKNNIKRAINRLDQLRDIIDFNLFLLKTKETKTLNKSNQQKDFDLEKFLDKFKVKNVDVHEFLIKAIETVSLNLDSHHYKRETTQKRLDCLTRLKDELLKKEHIIIKGVAIAVLIVFTDLLKNAVQYSDQDEPEFCVIINKLPKYTEIHFHNNTVIFQDAADYINSFGETKTPNKFKRNGGIRTIKRILSNILFKGIWEIKAVPNQSKGETQITLTINH